MNQTKKTVQTVPEIQKLLGKLIKQGVLELKPTLNKKGICYLEIEENLKDADSVYVENMIQNLKNQKILEPKFIDRVLTCPDCSSPEVYSKYACPKCDSYNVDYIKLIEHTKCGYIGSKDKFIKGSFLVCPGCQLKFKEDVKAIPLLQIGSCYQCEKCGQRFDKPEVIHICQQCNRSFTHQEAKYIKIYSYKIANETINKFSKDLPLFESVREILLENDLETQFHTQLTGTSGVQHPFDIVAKRKHVLLVADVSLTGNKNDVISLLGKKIDVNPTKTLLIDLSDGEELLSLGKVYGITVLKGGNEKQLRIKLREFIVDLDSNRNQEEKRAK